MKRSSSTAVVLLLVFSSLLATNAHALEGQKAARVGVGLEHLGGEASSSAAHGVIGGGYGLNDWLDLRASGTLARHSFCAVPDDPGCRDHTWHLSLRSSAVLKLDVIQWIPYAGPALSYHWLLRGPIAKHTHTHDFALGAVVGIGYAPVRTYGFGVEASYGAFLRNAPDSFQESGIAAIHLYTEYRWGW